MKFLTIFTVFLVSIFGQLNADFENCPVCPDVDEVVFLPSSSKCADYFVCEHGVPIRKTCPEGLHWDDSAKVCNWPDQISPPCTENIFGCANDKLALLSTHGLYVVAEDDGNANANREQKSSWETFTIDDLGDNKFSFRSVHDKYLVAENLFHGYEVNCDRDKASTWEKFNAEVQKDGKVAFKTAHKHYLVAERDGRLRANRLWVGSFEKFTPECRE